MVHITGNKANAMAGDLAGPEKIRLFKSINIPKVFPVLPNAAILQDIWTEFWHLFHELGKPDINPKQLQEDIKTWVRNFLKVYQTKNITPYVHAFVFHVPEFIEAYGNICQFFREVERYHHPTLLESYKMRNTEQRNTE